MKILNIATYISLFLFSQCSYSLTIGHPKTDEDFSLLPPYCKVNMHAGYEGYRDPVEAKMWDDRLHGTTGIWHYCWGLHQINLANQSADINQRRGYLSQAIGDMRYTQERASQDSILLPKIYYDIGQTLEELDDDAGAMEAYYQCIKLNPKLPRPYAALSDLFKNQNKTKQAVAILEEGLKYKPKSKTLLKRLAQLTKEK